MAYENFTFGNRNDKETPDTPPVEGGDTGVAARSPHAGGKHVPSDTRERPVDENAPAVTEGLEVPDTFSNPTPAEQSLAAAAPLAIAQRREQAKRGLSKRQKAGLMVGGGLVAALGIGGGVAAVNHFGGERYEVTIDGETEEMKANEIKELQPGAEYFEFVKSAEDYWDSLGDISTEEFEEKVYEFERKKHDFYNEVITPKLGLALNEIAQDGEANIEWLTFSGDITDQLQNIVKDIRSRTLLGEDDRITVVDSDLVDNTNLHDENPDNDGTVDRVMTVVVTHSNGSEQTIEYSIGDVVPSDIRKGYDDPADIRLMTSGAFSMFIADGVPEPEMDPGFHDLTEAQKRDAANQFEAIKKAQ